ncbi:MAG: ABC transporter substrate-binding protein [Candidatus Hermodarchaeota archaeon]
MSRKYTRAGILLVLVICLILPGLTVKAQTTEYLFSVTIIAPLSGTFRPQLAQLMANELSKIGIEAIVTLVGWDILFDRVFELPQLDYNNGGFDIAVPYLSADSIDYRLSRLYNHYHSSMKAPEGSNYFPVENNTLDEILEFIMNTTEFNERKEYIRQALDMIVWDIQPETSVCQLEDAFFMRNNIEGFDPNRFPNLEEIYFTNGQSIGHGQVNELLIGIRDLSLDALIDPTYFYGILNFNPVFSRLLELDKEFRFVPGLLKKLPYPIAVKNNYTGEISSTDPNTATVWELELRDNVYWHEGYGYRMNNTTHRDILKFDTDDVDWYFTKLIHEHSTLYNDQYVFGRDPEKAIVKINRYKVQFHLNHTYADLLTLFNFVLPQHILDPTYDALGLGSGVRADGTSAPSYNEWEPFSVQLARDDYGQGKRTSGDLVRPATIGTGAYMYYPGENTITQTFTFTKWDHYFKDNDTIYRNLVQNRPDKCIYIEMNLYDAGLPALENGVVDIVGPYSSPQNYIDAGLKPGIVAAKKLSWYYYTVGYNILNGAERKLANKYVRLAISHMIPRQDIVEYLLHGFGQANFIPFSLQSPYYPKDLDPIEYNIFKSFNYMEAAGYDMTPYKTQTPPSFISFEGWTLLVVLGGMGILVFIHQYKKKK